MSLISYHKVECLSGFSRDTQLLDTLHISSNFVLDTKNEQVKKKCLFFSFGEQETSADS